MSTESISDRYEHIRSISVTALSALLGVAAAFVCLSLYGTGEAGAQNQEALLIVLGAIVIQFPIIKLSGIYNDDEFGVKHYLFIAFMTFSLWFLSWGIMLETGVTI